MWNFLWVSCKPHLSTQAPTSLIREVWSGSNTFILPCPHPLNGTTTDFLLGGVFARRLQPNHVPCAHWSFKDTPKLRAYGLLYYCLPPSQNSAALDGLKADQYSQCTDILMESENYSGHLDLPNCPLGISSLYLVGTQPSLFTE